MSVSKEQPQTSGQEKFGIYVLADGFCLRDNRSQRILSRGYQNYYEAKAEWKQLTIDGVEGEK